MGQLLTPATYQSKRIKMKEALAGPTPKRRKKSSKNNS